MSRCRILALRALALSVVQHHHSLVTVVVQTSEINIQNIPLVTKSWNLNFDKKFKLGILQKEVVIPGFAVTRELRLQLDRRFIVPSVYIS